VGNKDETAMYFNMATNRIAEKTSESVLIKSTGNEILKESLKCLQH
jgi:hypothetical protein